MTATLASSGASHAPASDPSVAILSAAPSPLLTAAEQLDSLGFRAFASRLRSEPDRAAAVIFDFLSPPPEMARAIGAMPTFQAGNAVLRPLLSLVRDTGSRWMERSTWYTPSGPENTVAV